MGFKSDITKIKESFNEDPIIHKSQRHLGIILTMVGYILYALYTVFFQTEVFKNHASNSMYFIFFELTVLNFVMTIVFLIFCLGQGKSYFTCNRPVLVTARSLFAFLLTVFYSLSKVWSDKIDNSILYSTDSFWLILFLHFLHFRFPKGVWLGVIVGTIGIFFIYSFDFESSQAIIGAIFGTLSGILLSVVIFMTRYMIRRDPPLRICFYCALISLIGSALCTFIFGLVETFALPAYSSIYVMVVSGLIWGLALFCFIESYYFLENHVIGAIAFFLPIFVETFNWEINFQIINWSSLTGSIIMTLGAILVIVSTYQQDKKRNKKDEYQFRFPEILND
jgi:drug/metabolite transporter (DMT)-like permease